MADKSADESSLVFSYLTLRRAIGLLGIALPEKALMDSLQSTYEGAANLAKWDRRRWSG